MNPYAFFPLVAAFMNIGLSAYIFYINPKNRLNILYALMAASTAVWGFGNFLVFTASSAQSALVFDSVVGIAASFTAAFLLHFFMAFTENVFVKTRMRSALLYIPALFFSYISATNAYNASASPEYWGYAVQLDFASLMISAFIAAYSTIAVVLCYIAYRKSLDRQLRLLVIAISIPIVGGVLTKIILPYLFGIVAMPLASTLTTITVLIVGYSIRKYKLLKPLKLSIRNSIVALLVIFVLVPVIVTGVAIFSITEAALTQEISNMLTTAVHENGKVVNMWLDENEKTTMALSEDRMVREFLSMKKNSTDYQNRMEVIDEVLNGIKKSRFDILKISILDRNGVVVASTDKSAADVEKSDVAEILGSSGMFIKDAHISKGFGVPCIDYGLPVLDDRGNLIGGVVLDISILHIAGLTKNASLGKTGEIYITNKEGFMITPSRFLNDTILKQRIGNKGMCPAVSGDGKEDIIRFRNYRGKDVLGSYLYIRRTGWCVVGEIEARDAFSSLETVKKFIIFYTILIVLLTTALAVFLSYRLTEPLLNLTRDVRVSGKRKVNFAKYKKSRDEVGELAAALEDFANRLGKSEKMLKMYASRLEKMVGERTKELNVKVKELSESKAAMLNMLDDTDASNRQLRKLQNELRENVKELKESEIKKNQFISIAAHELKTPLTAIHGFSQLLQNKDILKDTKKSEKYLKIMENETMRLSKLVSDILDLSRMDMGTIKVVASDVNLSEFMKDLIKEISLPMKKKGLKLTTLIDKDLPVMKTDREKLMQILINLVNNAIKYTDHGTITLEAHAESGGVHFVVKDTGIGISREMHEKIFERFYQVDSSYTRSAGGTGLGLSLVKEFVNLLGGKIWLVSKKGLGSEFHVTLPLSAPLKDELELAPQKPK